MANRYWVNDDVDGNWAGTNNWSTTSGGAGGAATPTGSDDVFFNAASSNDNCTMSANAACLSMAIGTSGSAYTGTLDAATFDVGIGAGGLDCSDGGSATLDLGSGTWTCAGDWDNGDIGTLTQGTSTVLMTGTATIKTFAKNIYSLEIAATGDVTIGAGTYCRVDGSLMIRSGGELTQNSAESSSLTVNVDLTLEATGTLNGTGEVIFSGDTLDNSAGGTYAPASTVTSRAVTINAGIYGGTMTCNLNNGSRTLTIGGNVTFTGALTIDADVAGTFTIDNSGNYTITCQDAVTFAESTGTLAITEGTGTWAMTSTGDQVITNTAALDNIGHLLINKGASGQKVTLASAITCQNFTGQEGTFDPAGQTITIAGNCDWQSGFDFNDAVDTLNGSTWAITGNFTTVAIDLASNSNAGWTLTVSGTAVASGTGDVADCNAGGTEIDASAGPWTDSGSNTNWNFGSGLSIPIAMYHYMHHN